jgi:hypothetical protein
LKRFYGILALGILLACAASAALASVAERSTDHFRFLYDPDRLTKDQAIEAGEIAEKAFADVSKRFPNVKYDNRIVIRLDAHFRGATGYAAPGGISGKGKIDAIGLRYEDLSYLGLTPSFLFHHELTHLFSARWENGTPEPFMAGSALGEGLADYVADGRNEMGLPLSYAKYLRDQDFWANPLSLFLNPPGGGPPRQHEGRLDYSDVLRWRIERYVEPSLFIAFVSQKIGWDKVRDFYLDYARSARANQPSTELRRVIRTATGSLPEDFFSEWRKAMDAAPKDETENRDRWQSERAYAAAQWYDFLVAGKAIGESDESGIESDFKKINEEIAAQKRAQAEGDLKAVIARVAAAAHGHARGDYILPLP